MLYRLERTRVQSPEHKRFQRYKLCWQTLDLQSFHRWMLSQSQKLHWSAQVAPRHDFSRRTQLLAASEQRYIFSSSPWLYSLLGAARMRRICRRKRTAIPQSVLHRTRWKTCLKLRRCRRPLTFSLDLWKHWRRCPWWDWWRVKWLQRVRMQWCQWWAGPCLWEWGTWRTWRGKPFPTALANRYYHELGSLQHPQLAPYSFARFMVQLWPYPAAKVHSPISFLRSSDYR